MDFSLYRSGAYKDNNLTGKNPQNLFVHGERGQ